ncbi:hypothetical protein MY1_1023 [Nitrosarchaeum koreense MY1]|uniref:Uncharacterized protein n=1 Tax=Nitrosarchaeum koreense MY1 TaxID=1001994 RepID=F9CWY1_9ARCH|nr:hypothetical protein MY1_1023 [Nitrosarchaeum koreense MY1]
MGDVFKPSNMQTALLPIFFMFLIMKKTVKMKHVFLIDQNG